MYNFKLNENIVLNNFNPDYYYAIYKINIDVLKKVQDCVSKSKELFENPQSISRSISNQAILLLKNEYLSYVLVHEYEIAKRTVLKDTIEKEKFKKYIELTNNIEWLEYAFEKYPLLKGRIEVFISNFVENLLFFISALTESYDNIKSTFSINNKIVEFDFFLGDFHKKNKNVIKILFKDSKNIYYKPRNFSNEVFLDKLITFFNNKFDIDIEYIIPKSINYEKYSWSEEITGKNNFKNKKEIEKYWLDQGKLLFLFYLLDTIDIIPDNLIIAKNKPAYFDLECLINKPIYSNNESVRSTFEQSVIKTGMLPVWMINNNLKRNILSSTFFSFNTQVVNKKSWIKDFKSNYLYKDVEETLAKGHDKHLPIYNNQPEELEDVNLINVKEGFSLVYNTTLSNKDTIQDFLKNNLYLISKEQRVLLHPTSIYSLLLKEICIPETLQDNSEIDRNILSIIDYGETDNNSIDKFKLLDSIKKQIFNLDIPYFYFNSENNCLYDGFDKCLSKNWWQDFDQKPITKLKSLNSADLRTQLNVIEKTIEFAFQIKRKENIKLNKIKYPKNVYSYTKQENLRKKLLNTAIKIGDKILSEAIEIKDTINWISKVRNPNDGRYQISLLTYDLYDGLSGVSFFYVYLYKYTHKLSYKVLSLKIYNLLNEQVAVRKKSEFYKQLSDSTISFYPLSPYYFPVSQIYLSIHIKSILGNKYIDFKILNIILDDLIDFLPPTKNFDFLNGVSGLINLLIDFKTEFNSEEKLITKVDILIEISKNILIKNSNNKNDQASWIYTDNSEEKSLGGFAHGTAGICTSLFKLSNKLKNEKMFKLAKKALNHDRSFFDPKINGWVDTRDSKFTDDSTAWCHGSVGIGLSRLLIEQHLDNDTIIEEELKLVRRNILKYGFLGDHSICHGDFGNIEILKAINDKFGYKNDKLYSYLEKVIDSYNEGNDFICGDGEKMNLIGLFTGYTGFAYQMLRFYDWTDTPSLLCAETPKNKNYGLH